ncbi:MAG: hypothetical protein CMG74_08935 [Candidatus Marinimicrobia bacterium]|nr:hypothetical protein [Candidatus Neomarinimicrobiota bacterium]|tara:strand:+ start:96 stop:719 length:624 start_codon:yes stop_codon:yes gene_type:complete
MIPTFIRQLTERLSQPLPGKKAQEIMMIYPDFSYMISSKNPGRIAASVLILLFPKDHGWNFFLTKRTNKVEHHKNQISLPGGTVEHGETIAEAALRETYEEIGVRQNLVNVIGSLTSFNIPTSCFEIFPVVGWVDKEPITKVNQIEVERIFSVSLDTFLDEKIQKDKKRIFRGKIQIIPYFYLGNEQVWGATSIILSEFKMALKEIF